MPSSKGKPTDPKLREEVKEKVQNETNKDGSGKGQWSAWKASKLSKEYEKEGGGYENVAGSKNEPAKGPPEAKSEATKKEEVKNDTQEKDTKEKPKANSAKKATGKKGDSKAKAPKEKKEPAAGTRKSTRIGTKRSAPDEETEPQEKEVKEKAPGKKAKTANK